MKLDDYLNSKGISRDDFGRLIGVSGVAITRYIGGKRLPRKEHLQAIAHLTAGAVTPNDFLDVISRPAPSTTEVAA